MSPFKRALVDDEGTLRFGWWEGNARLMGPTLPPLDPAGHALSAVNGSIGAVVEATIQLPPATTKVHRAGLSLARCSLDDFIRHCSAARVWAALPSSAFALTA